MSDITLKYNLNEMYNLNQENNLCNEISTKIPNLPLESDKDNIDLVM